MESIIIHDKKFRLSIPLRKIAVTVNKLARQLNRDLQDKDVVFIAVLNGSFMFAADLLKKIRLSCRISFVKLSSYEGTETSGHIHELIGIQEELTGKTVVVIEDVVDSGSTLDALITRVKTMHPSEIITVTLLFKPDAYEYHTKIDYTGFRIPAKFIVGYGLDYDGLGRNLNGIYTLVEE